MGWLSIISYSLQLLYSIIQNKFENDKYLQARKDILHAEAKTAISNNDMSAITAIFDKLRT